ncbi:MAG: hypothetical protein PHN56_04815 [Candidatus Nanoarchaeia archaeon]|nr:hypothetical protein [Candidatus Nanoarchaeia archaeon]
MLRTILIPLSYLIGYIISKITKDELIIRKKWLTYWPYLIALIPLALLINSTLCIITISLINYLKSSYDLIYKIKCKNLIFENLIFLITGLLVSVL